MKTDEILKGRVNRMAFGGQGIVRHEGLVVFVPFTAVDDLISFRITSKKKNFAQGELVEVLESSPLRTTPLCPYFGTCGGCQLQHINYQAQLSYKHQSVEDAFQRIGKLSQAIIPPVHPATECWNYRRRIMLSLRPHEGHFLAGYLSTDNHSLVPVEQCAIFLPQNNPVISNIQQLVAQLDNSQNQNGKLMVLKEENGCYLLHFQFESLPSNIEKVIQNSFNTSSTWSGILVTTPQKKLVFGTVSPQLTIEDLTFTFSPQAFIQNHPEQSLNIYRSIVAHAKRLNSKTILDLYCGIGISSLLLAKHGFQVVGVETNGEAVKMAQVNAANNQLSSKAQFIKADVQQVLQKLLKSERPELVIVNPPRTGLDKSIVEALLKQAPLSILYISCMPATLARDLKAFCEHGYQLLPTETYDMFPQTAHVETLVLLQRL